MNNKRFALLCAILAIVISLSMLLASCTPTADSETTGTDEHTTEVTTDSSIQTTEETTEETTESITESSAETTEETTESATESSAETTEETTESTIESSAETTEETTESTAESSEQSTDESTELTESSVESTEETTESATESSEQSTDESTELTEATTESETEPETEPHFTITIEGMSSVSTAPDGSYVLSAPEKSGYRFMGWVTESGNPFAAQGIISGNVSIRPIFEKLTNKGLTFSSNERVYMTDKLSAFPITLKFNLKLAEDVPEGVWYGVFFSNSIRWDKHLAYQINELRQPSINFGFNDENAGGLRWFAPKAYHFDQITLPVGEEVELYFIMDIENARIHCYVNGEFGQTIDVNPKYFGEECYNKNPFVIGGNTTGSNYLYFRGEMLAMSAWSDVRTDAEIATGGVGSPQMNDKDLLVKYQFHSVLEDEVMMDLSGSGYDLSVEKLWLDKSEVESANGDYCFAVVGDTQSMMQWHRDDLAGLYDWIASNKNELGIEFVIGLGDITENSTEEEWEFARQSVYKLSGIVPFSLAMGNHDKYEWKDTHNYVPDSRADFYFNKYFYDNGNGYYYKNEISGYYSEEGEGDITNSYRTIKLGNTDWLILTLDFGPTDAMLEWANEVVADHPDHKTIVISHAYLYRDGTTIDREDCYPSSRYNPIFNDGDDIFNKLIKKHENIVLTLGGHDPHDHIVCSQVVGEKGNVITQMLIDPQYMDNFYGSTGMVALLYYTEETETLTVRYYSTAKDTYGSEHSQFTVKLGELDPKYQSVYTITVDGGDSVVTAPGGSYVLTAPQKDGYRFMGWVTADGEEFPAQSVISGDVSVYPVFEKLTDVGMTFSTNERISMTETLSAFPTTVNFKVILDSDVPKGTAYGVLASNTIRWDKHLTFQINAKQQPVIHFGLIEPSETGMPKFAPATYTFSKIFLPVGEEIDISFVFRLETVIETVNGPRYQVDCYLNGVLAQSIKVNVKYIGEECYNKNPFVIGGLTTGSNYLCLRGEMLSMAMWSDVRTDNEIATGGIGSPEINDEDLLVKYEFYGNLPDQVMLDMSGKGQHLVTETLWLNQADVEPASGDYCFAVLGDTQSLMHCHPNKFSGMFNWLVNNSGEDKHNIKYVLGLGDITENALVWEWELSKMNLAKLENIGLPYLMAMGNHDKYDFKDTETPYVPDVRSNFLFNQYFYNNELYRNSLDGYYTAEGDGDVTCAYDTIECGTTKWLMLTLDFGPTDAMLDWANEVVAAHPDHLVIVTTHAYLYRDGTTIDVEDCYTPSIYNSAFNNGHDIFNDFIYNHENIVLVLSGHDPHDHIVYSRAEGKEGNTVWQMLINPQYVDEMFGPAGMVALFYYTEETHTMTVRYYSTAMSIYGSEQSQFTITLDIPE
ncbi:MAG: metallophosphoesterase [Clostridia bacterium]|nr:metallophosphoesterase [Clostridia bacterium]